MHATWGSTPANHVKANPNMQCQWTGRIVLLIDEHVDFEKQLI